MVSRGTYQEAGGCDVPPLADAGAGPLITTRLGAERRSLAFRPRFQRLPAGIGYAMERERAVKRERDELESLAAEAGLSVDPFGITALVLVVALIVGLVV